MLVTDSVADAMAHIDLHAVQHFGLKRTKAPRPRKIFGESPLKAHLRADGTERRVTADPP
jgi:hypothetical protein